MKRADAAQMVQDYASEVTPIMVSEYGSAVERNTIRELGRRMLGAAGKYEVDEDTQSFELAGIDTMLVGLREELLDVVNYCAMLDTLAQREGMGFTSMLRLKLRMTAGDALRGAVEVEMNRRNRPGSAPAGDYVTLLGQKTGMDHG